MPNFFLLNEALVTNEISLFEQGLLNLNNIIAFKKGKPDMLLKDENFWEKASSHGYFYDLPNLINRELVDTFYKVFNSFNSSPIYISNIEDFNILFEYQCNGFKGFDFSNTNVLPEHQVTDLVSYKKFCSDCLTNKAYDSIENYWEGRTELFKSIVFCENVKEQILQFSMKDDRFNLINSKITHLNNYTKSWKTGAFNHKNLGLDCSPDTPTRIKNTLAQRTFVCPDIGAKPFSLHIKWSYGKEVFRLYFYPDDATKKVYIGYIGDKAGIGF